MPFYESTGTGSATVRWIRPKLAVEIRRLQIVIKQIAHDTVGEKLHPAIGVMDYKPFAGTEQLVRNHQGSDGVVRSASASVANHMGVTFGKARVLRGVQAGIHAGEDRESTRRWQRQVLFSAETRRIFLVGCDNFINNPGHGLLSPVVRQRVKSTFAGFASEFQSLPICSELLPASRH